MKHLKKVLCLILALTMALSLSMTAFAAGDTIDPGQTASLNIYKYDLTRAEAEGAWTASSYVSTGIYDESVNSVLGNTSFTNNSGTNNLAYGYAIKGVKFGYLKVADISTYSERESDGVSKTMILYGLPANDRSTQFLSILGLTYEQAHHREQASDTENVYYFVSDVLISALAKVLSNNATSTKSAMESFVAAYGGTTLPETDEYGHTSANSLPLGLYVVVEQAVPDMVTCTTDPFLVSLPMTTIDGNEWNYDVTVYPKNATGMPTLEKTLREAQADTGKNNGSTGDIEDGFAHTGTASDGDVIDYQIISTLPSITSDATHLTTYTFVDKLSAGLDYNKNDVVIEFFRDKACTDKIATWTEADKKFDVSYGSDGSGSTMTISMTSTGLGEINTNQAVYGTSGSQRGYSGCTMRITYAATMHSDASVVYGEQGNPNEVQLTWRRTNEDYYDVLDDDCHVYTYGVDLTKEFSDGSGNFENVKMIVHNDTDDYYLQAELADGIFYVTGHTAEKDSATVFTPTQDGKIIVKGMEDDTFSVTETETDSGYVLLKDDIEIVITTAEGEICEKCHKPLLTASGTVNGKDVEMSADGGSLHAYVPLKVVNTKGFSLPQTGSFGTAVYTTVGILVMAGTAILIFMLTRRRTQPKHHR